MGLLRRGADVDRMRQELAELHDALERHGRSTTQRLDHLDARLTSVSTELVNQLTELGHELDALEGGPDLAAIDALRDGQVRLASEQARYQIAFRDDLARLAGSLPAR